MKKPNTLKNAPLKIEIYYVCCLALTMVISFWLIGSERIIASAMSGKPYSVLINDYHFSGLLREHHEKKLIEDRHLKRILLLGDSAVFYPPDPVIPRDTNSTIHLSAMILNSITSRTQSIELRISDWSYIGATLFDRYCFYYLAKEYQPDMIIIPIHWRSFGSPWQNNPAFFRPELSALVPFRSELPEDYKDPLKSAGITTIKQLEYKISIYSLFPVGAKLWTLNSLRIFFGGQLESGDLTNHSENGRMTQNTLSEVPESENSENLQKPSTMSPAVYSKHFPMKVESSHRALCNISALSHVASKHKTKLLFFLWPVDWEYFEKLGIYDQVEFERSRQLIRNAVRGENIFFVDLSTMLRHEDIFDWQGHFTVKGRRKIAEALAPTILSILEDQPIIPDPS